MVGWLSIQWWDGYPYNGGMVFGRINGNMNIWRSFAQDIKSSIPELILYTYNKQYRCNRLRCPLARLSGLQCFNMGHNGHRINLYGVVMILMGN